MGSGQCLAASLETTQVPSSASITPGEQGEKLEWPKAPAGGGSPGWTPHLEDVWDAVAMCTEGGECHRMLEEGMWRKLLYLLCSISLQWRFRAGAVSPHGAHMHWGWQGPAAEQGAATEVSSVERGLRWLSCTWDPQRATRSSHVSL